MHRRQFLAAAGQLSALSALPHRIVSGDEQPPAASGPLKVHPANPRYFSNADGEAVLLTGSHVWNNLVDMGRNEPPEPFDYAAYLDFLERYGHNFIRMWAWDSVTWDTQANRRLGKDFIHRVAPQPWVRSGPGEALDGGPRFDLSQFDPVYFERLRARVSQAGRRGIYVSVMLFEGWGLMHGNLREGTDKGWAWRGHPFHPGNNINGVDAGVEGDVNVGRPHSRNDARVNEVQAAYIRKVVDTVNDLDNVLYEVINEGGDQAWDWWVVRTLREYERSQPRLHPIGITGHGAEPLASMLASPADWISPGSRDGYRDDPPAWDGKKVSLLDTDHVWGVGGNSAWVWKAFLRGHNPIFMDPYDGEVLGQRFDPQWEPIRRSMGFARRLSQRVPLATMTPQDDLASTRYCLADPGSVYLVYLPQGGDATVDLRKVDGTCSVEWLECATGDTRAAAVVDGGTSRTFRAPFRGDAVLHLWTG